MRTASQMIERLKALDESAQAAMDAIDAKPPVAHVTVTYKLYIAPSGRKYVTLVGTLNSTAFAEVLAPVTDDMTWEATIAAVVAREEGRT